MKKLVTAIGAALLLASAPAVLAKELILHAVQYPEDKKVGVHFAAGAFGAGAELDGKVEYVKGRAQILLEVKGLKPAVLHGGDVTSYVLWAVTRTAAAENLGELWIDHGNDKVRYTAPHKELALMVTAESHPLVDRPSELVVFHSLEVDARRTSSTPFAFRDFAEPPAYDKDSVADLEYTGTTPLSVIQAQKVLELARRQGTESRAPRLHHDAEVTLAQAVNLAAGSKEELALDYARRSLALASEALRLAARQREAEALEARIRERREDVRELEDRAAEAEARRADLAREVESLRAGLTALRRENDDARAARAELERQRQELARQVDELETDKTILEAGHEALKRDNQALENEKRTLETSLRDALSEIAETRSTARGLIVTLPDILFDFDRASLKPQARSTLAKLAGVLQLVPDVDLEIEGHTDSTGTEAYNLDLSRRRAESVERFLAGEGVSPRRMSSRGFGEERPIADNDTVEGRSRNRRVEIVLPGSAEARLSRAGAAVGKGAES